MPNDEEGVLKLQRERAEFIERVREGERQAAADPAGYRRRLRGLVFLGYAYIGLLVAVALALVAALVAFVAFGHRLGSGVVKLGLLLAIFLFGVLHSLWVKIPPPEGLLIARRRVPRLWQEVEAVADRLKAPRPDEIRLDENFNASATQWPRFGFLGGYRSTLTLGLPLLASLDHQEALGVIAHEFGHFSGEHGRFGVWIYRVNATWSQLGANLSSGGAGLFRPFVNWFIPRFAAASFALRRQQEYEADRAAAEVVGAATVAGTLSRLDALGEHQQKAFWDPLEREMERVGSPATGYFARMAETIRQPLDHDAADRRLAFALAQPTDYDDSHPSLSDRLKSLGQPSPESIAPVPGKTSVEAFFGDALPGIVADLERDYAARMAPVWAHLDDRRGRHDAALAELERKVSDRPPTEEEAVELTFLRNRNAEPEAALASFRALHAAYPENATAAFLLGERLTEADDPSGPDLLRFAAERDPDFADAARRTLGGYHARRGDHAAFAALRDEAQDAYDRQATAEEASVPTLQDELLPPDLTPEEVARLRTALEGLKGLGQAYAFRKRLPGTGELRHYLFFVPKPASLVGEDPLAHFTKQLTPDTDLVRPFMLMANPKPKPWRKRLAAIPGATVYDHKAAQ